MIFRAPWLLVILALGWTWIISASTGPASSIMKTLGKLVRSSGKTCPKKLTRLCRRESNLTEVLQEAVTLAVEHCQEEFRYTRWNCTLDKKLFQEVSRESAVVTAIFAASLSHAFARSCVGRKFPRCNQTNEENFTLTERQWQLKSRSDDVKFGRRMAKKILLGTNERRQRKRTNFKDAVSIHNVEIGLRAAAKMEEICQCHGYSASCTVQLCRKRLVHFKNSATVLRSRYTEAKMISEADSAGGLFSQFQFPRGEKNRFYYTAPSPNFCKDTHGRECLDEMNCSILCCARGFRTREIKTPRKCRCVVSGKCCDIKCQTCPGVEIKYTCK